MHNANFENSSILIKVVQHFESYLSQCLGCGLIWSSDGKLKHDDHLSQMDLKILECCVDRLNDLLPSVKQLASWEIFVSHGLCRPCIREKMMEHYRSGQRRSGYHPCYATAMAGHCSQHECAYYDCCVVDQNELFNWGERKRRFLSEEACRRAFFLLEPHPPQAAHLRHESLPDVGSGLF